MGGCPVHLTLFLEAGATSSAEVVPHLCLKVKEGIRFGKFRVKRIETNSGSIKKTGTSFVSTELLLKADTAGLRTTLARNRRDTQVEVGVHVCPVCVGCVDTGPHPVPFFGASSVFTRDREL